jgi:hypothetical protein
MQLFIARTENIEKYTSKNCDEALREFNSEFRRSILSNYFLYSEGPPEFVSIHYKQHIWPQEEFNGIISEYDGLERMIDFFVREKFPIQGIKIPYPRLAITDQASYRTLIDAFAKFSYNASIIARR